MSDDVGACLRRVCQSQNLVFDDTEALLVYLKTEWIKTKTMVLIEFDYHPCYILMAYLFRYKRQKYQHAGELVEVVLDLEEMRVPVLNVDCIVQCLLSESIPVKESPPCQTISNKEKLFRETIHLLSEVRCKACFKYDANQLLVNCVHISLCEFCLKERLRCPFCDSPITGIIKVYPP